MAESSATQVILTDDGIKIINAQNTAYNAASGVANLNDPNLMSVIEKQTQTAQYAGLTSQYNVVLARAKDASISTTALTTAYTNLNAFMTAILTDTTKASDVDRDTYKSLTDAYNSALSKVQKNLDDYVNNEFSTASSQSVVADSNATAAKEAADSTYAYANSEIAVQSNATAKAQSTADNAFSQVQAVGSQASAEIKNNSTATAKAQSTADNAFSQATTAIDNGKVTSQTVTDLKDGSKLTIADLENGLATKVANSEYASYKVQTASQIAQKVDNGAFSAYQTQTADLIAQKVATSDFSAYQATTAKEISSKVESSDFNTYKTQTADLIDDKVSSSEYASDKTQTASEIADRVSNSAFSTYQTQTASQFAETVKEADFQTYQTQTSKLIEAKVDNGTYQTDKTQTAKDIASKVSSIDFKTYQTQTDKMISSKVSTADYDEQITLINNNINLKVAKGDLIDEINLQAGNTLISSSGQLTLAANTIYFDTNKPVIIPSANIDSLLVGKKLTAADIAANTFSTNNGTFTVDSNGAITAKNMTLIGGTLTSPTINASTINGSTINGTTFNAGDIISSTYNTSQFYPTTITPAGLVATTGFNSMDGLRTEMSAGSFVTKYRAVNSNSNQYEAYDGVFSGDELVLNSGFTNGIDMGFQQSVSGNQLTGQVVLSPLNGIHLWGSTQSIHFSGLQMNGTGITFNSYGNIIADPASTWWRVTSFSGHDIANFGTDTAGSNVIQFNRELDIGNFQINTGHTFISADGDAIHFAKGRGGAVDIYAGDVHYNSLVKSSLLSVKKDVQKADTSYWAQLVNSIDLATYQYKTDDNTSHLRLSSIVDDVNVTKQWQLPDVFISRDENGKLSGVDDSVLLNATLATVQEQQKQISALNGHLLELEAKSNG
ncbi:phage tail protein [Lactiplantibacillus plantarum]|uniref:phage tail protein n=1 Tax=Lactiplantibacillus plantarum TaxID=1590 RepID=UPI0025571104|nr:phage tail protein [Lactiplantibacillus plantarum]